jgi:excinuclease ABC subunit B
MDGAHSLTAAERDQQQKVAETTAKYQRMPPAELGQSLAELEKQMIHHAEMLEFEEAAEIRDQIKRLKEHVLIGP